ncbi:DUF397 domain-containing protein [Streptomyces sp. 840.1]|uniref:DUF397 domain-containing protein n=1 Tax=Streptomyces sp. 840.1 TaxID=2485152 RepID=UPI0021A765CB|nr:DUF397 domain-containing protein [Streptomyces sp. 840.1]
MPELGWQRSPFCGGGGNNCVEITASTEDGLIALRKSEPGSPPGHRKERPVRAACRRESWSGP